MTEVVKNWLIRKGHNQRFVDMAKTMLEQGNSQLETQARVRMEIENFVRSQIKEDAQKYDIPLATAMAQEAFEFVRFWDLTVLFVAQASRALGK